MLKYHSRNIKDLPESIRDYVRSIAFAKCNDDHVKIIRHSGYEIWVWHIDLPVDICRLP